MKRIYTKPSLQMELFAVEDIMITTSDLLTGTNLTIENGGTIQFTEGNTLQSIDYKQFTL